MNSLKTLVVAKTFAAIAIAAGASAAPTLSHASPNDGMVCRAGYSAQFAGGTMKCTKTVQTSVGMQCPALKFTKLVIRAPGAPGDTSGGKDLCLRNVNGLNIGSTDPLTGLVLGQDYVFAELNVAQAASKAKAIEIAEERTNSLADDQVDATHTAPTFVVNGGLGSQDVGNFTVTLFTFPVPAPSLRPIVPNLPPVLPPIALRP
jgi:hypothetical protein